jgi:hypothetical protein
MNSPSSDCRAAYPGEEKHNAPLDNVRASCRTGAALSPSGASSAQSTRIALADPRHADFSSKWIDGTKSIFISIGEGFSKALAKDGAWVQATRGDAFVTNGDRLCRRVSTILTFFKVAHDMRFWPIALNSLKADLIGICWAGR